MMMTESETFVEYDEAGLIKGAPLKAAKSKYAEGVLMNNHTSVWGSWWSNFKWGYGCCHSLIKNSYCTGEEGKLAWEIAEQQRTGANLVEDEANGEAVDEQESDTTRVKKRTRDEMMNGVTEAEMEEYRRKRTAANDPMAKILGRDELLT
ncbi:hypothetical protein G6O67_000066 [Ophiocordyceps sinensis]|nr:hypothetical protein G6O67_000066 [Ophiocordyceps sinensis]